MFSRSWKTSCAGLMAAALAVYPELTAWTNNQSVNWRMVALAAGLAFVGFFARDKNVSSEQQGVRK